MAPDDPHEGGRAMVFPVVADGRISTEFGKALGADAPIRSEAAATIRADMPIQIEWLDAIEAALRDLRERQIADPALLEAAAIAARLRAAIGSQRPSAATTALWLCLYGSISAPFLNHFGSAVGHDLGHATAQKIIEVLSSLSQYLRL